MSRKVTDNIEAERVRNRMTLDAFCEALGTPRDTYKGWRKKGDVSCSVIIKCMEIFNVSADYLLRDVQ